MENLTKINEADVLIVEDSPNDAGLIFRALAKLNSMNKIFWVKDGEEALEFVFHTGRYTSRDDSTPLKVILLDLKLPKVNGFEVLAKIKSDKHTKKIPVVVLTSSQEDNDLKESHKYGVKSYIIKPIEAENFVKALSEVGLYLLSLNKPPKASNRFPVERKRLEPITKHILIIDDDPITRRLFGGLLGRAGYEVIYAKNGEEGREIARRFHPDLILMDMNMPGGDSGQQTADRIKNEPNSLTADIPIVFLTNNDLPTEMLKWMKEFGVTDYIQKGVGNEEFIERVKKIIDSSSP